MAQNGSQTHRQHTASTCAALGVLCTLPTPLGIIIFFLHKEKKGGGDRKGEKERERERAEEGFGYMYLSSIVFNPKNLTEGILR